MARDLDNVDTISVLAASIAHEVNQPLSGILTNASTCLRMLSADPPNIEGARATAVRTLRDVERAADVLKRLPALFAQTPMAAEVLDLNATVRAALAQSRRDLVAAGTSVTCALAPRLPHVIGDDVQLQLVIANLLRNAAEAMSSVRDRRRQLTIVTRMREDGQAEVGVRDVGIGFRDDDVEKLFTPFHTTKARGMGIGLSLSRSIAEKHSGRLWGAPNREGPGATFWLSIPCTAQRSRRRTVARRAAQDQSSLALASAV